ncbi:hypothetical protein [Pseudoalteromonas sp. 1181_04]|uniref:hypothetical protein n=1 Tax=Pseudoalteromonas sp. 1181_04 TaxID=2604450 RepID=UPI0040637FD9
MYLKLKKTTYEELLLNANKADMALATYINQILDHKIIQQGSENEQHGQRVSATECK